jgi:hypothetical protein
MINIPVGEPDLFQEPVQGIHDPQHLRLFTQGEFNSVAQPVVMDIYTGTCAFDFSSGSFDGPLRDNLVSLGPLGTLTGSDVDLQNYPGPVEAIISASMTSFGDEPTGAAVDGATVKLESHTFPHFQANVLVINADIGVEAGNLHRLAYQVTAFTQISQDQDLHQFVVHVNPDQETPAH